MRRNGVAEKDTAALQCRFCARKNDPVMPWFMALKTDDRPLGRKNCRKPFHQPESSARLKPAPAWPIMKRTPVWALRISAAWQQCRRGASQKEMEDGVILQESDCVLEIGRAGFSVTRISRGKVHFHRHRFIACGRASGRLNFGSGVSFAVSGTVKVLGGREAVLRDVRVMPAVGVQEDAFGLNGLPEGNSRPAAARRCA